MKKLFLVGALALFGAMNAQTAKSSNGATAKGKWVVETNAGSPLASFGVSQLGGSNTAFTFSSVDGNTSWNIGAEGGYFVADKLAIKAGLGYGDSDNSKGLFSYRLGAQYYFNGNIPVGVDFNGASTDGESVNFVGLEGGYAWFVAPNLAVTPKVRYNITTDDKKAESAFQGLIGFSLFF